MVTIKPRWLPPINGRAATTQTLRIFENPSSPWKWRPDGRRYAPTSLQIGHLFGAQHLGGQCRRFSACAALSRRKETGGQVSSVLTRKSGPRAESAFGKAFSNLELELRQSRPYDGFDIPASKFWTIFRNFETDLESSIHQAVRSSARKSGGTSDVLLNRILRAPRDSEEVGRIIKIEFYNRVMRELFTPEQLERQKTLMDCRYPMEWYPRARLTKRVLHLHVGPTNSGKTYQALKKLEAAQVGCYAGPLRLLAQEIYGRMNARGRPTWLMTGDDQQVPSIPYEDGIRDGITSCTVEMIDYERAYDVAVIDEVQMAADKHRGHAWTAAIVGVPAKEVHLCGEVRTVPLIQEIARSLGEELVIHNYERLSPLAVSDAPLANISRLERGDCIVCFSVMRIHAMKKHIERMTNKRVAIIYGSLPPEVRAQQARLFNEQDNDYDFLVASDAIGMGLNLAISRIIFDTIRKFTKSGSTVLTTPEIRQIGGRAGRYRTAAQQSNTEDDASKEPDPPSVAAVMSTPSSLRKAKSTTKIGLVTAFESSDLSAIRKSMKTDPEPITKFGVVPTNDMIELFCTYFPPTIPYSFILARMLEISQVSQRYFFCDMHDSIEIADVVQSVHNLSIPERVKLCFAPVSLAVPGHAALVREMAEAIANQAGGALLALRALDFSCLDEPVVPTRECLLRLEVLHKGLVLYLWMSFRFPGVFGQRPLAIKAKMLVEENIETCLTSMKYGNLDKTRLRNVRVLEFGGAGAELAEGAGAVQSSNDGEAESHERSVLHELQESHQSGSDLLEKGIDFTNVTSTQDRRHATGAP